MAVANPYMSTMEHDTIDAGIESLASVKPESKSGSSSYTNESSTNSASSPRSSHSGTPGPTSAPDRVNGSRKYKSRPIWATKAESQSPPIAPRTRAESPDWTNAPSPPSPQGDHGSSSTIGSDDAKSSESSTSPNSDKEQHKHDPYSKIYSSAQRASTSVPAWARTATSTTAEDGSTSASASSNGGNSADAAAAAAAAAATTSSMRKDSQSSEERERAGARQLYDKLRDDRKRPFSRVSGLTWSETADKFHPDMRPRKTANHEARMKKQRLGPSLFPREDNIPGPSSNGSIAIKKEPLDTRYDIPRSSYTRAPGIKQDPISPISPDEESFNQAELDRNNRSISGAMRNKPATEEERRLAEYNRLFGGMLADAEPTPTVQTDEAVIPTNTTTTAAPAARGRQPRIKSTDETLSAHLTKFSNALTSVSALRGQITTTLRDYATKIQEMERTKRTQDAEIQTLTHQGRLNEHKIQGLENANARLEARMETMERMVARQGAGGGAAPTAFATAATPATAIVLDDDDDDDVVVSERIGSLGSSDLESLFGRSGSDSNGVGGGMVVGQANGNEGSGDGVSSSFEDMFPVA